MGHLPAHKTDHRKDYHACSGCSLCLLVCPVWRQKRDLLHTAQGRAKAFQHEAKPERMKDSLLSCALCGSCNTICPEGIDLNGILASLRRDVRFEGVDEAVKGIIAANSSSAVQFPKGGTVFLPERRLRERPEMIKRVTELLGGEKSVYVAEDTGWDIALAFEAGVELPAGRLERFIDSMRGAGRIVVSDGIMKRVLRANLPGVKVTGIGEELSSLDSVIKRLRPTDLYVIESRSYNTDFQTLSIHYDTIRKSSKCAFNLDLHMAAIPTTATSMNRILKADAIDPMEQARWILTGRDVRRIVVENLEDGAIFREVTDIPVVYIGEVAGGGE